MDPLLHIALPAISALFLWWFSTGIVLYLDGLPARTYKWSILGATLVAIAAFYALTQVGDDVSPKGAAVGFGAGLMIWAWHEVTFLMGVLTGPRNVPCQPGVTGFRRFGQALATILYHEIAILLTAGAIVAITWDAANQVGTLTFLLLWVMRLSAKLNLFLGVRNLATEFLPDHLTYLASYFVRKPLNPLFPFSITTSTLITIYLMHTVLAEGAPVFEVVGYSFLATLMALAVIEHWFMVTPVSLTGLWRWAFRSRVSRGAKKIRRIIAPKPRGGQAALPAAQGRQP